MSRILLLCLFLISSLLVFAGTPEPGSPAPPDVDLGPDQQICPGDTVQFDATVTDAGATYQWQDGSSDPILTVTQPGDYSVTVTAGGESASDTVKVTFFSVPDLDLGMDTIVCKGDSVVFDLSDINVQVAWPDGSIGSRYVAYTTQLVRVQIDTRDGCTVSDEVQVTFVDRPILDLGGDREICDGGDVTIDATVSDPAFSYLWNDGNMQAVRSVTQSGEYSVTATNGGCSVADTILVNITNEGISVDLGPADTVLCDETSLTFDLSDIAGATFTWSDGSTDPVFTATSSGIVQVEVFRNGCTATDAIRVDFSTTPAIDLGPPSISLCQDEPYILQTQDPSATYSWSDGSTGSSLTVQQSGTYWVRADLNGCTASDTITVELTPIPTTDLDGDIDGCEGQPVTLDAGNPGADIEWQDGTIGPLFTVTQSGTYWVNIRQGACDVRDTITVTFQPAPEVDFETDEITACTGELVTLQPFISTADQVTWQDGSDGFTYQTALGGIFWAEAELAGCSSRDSVLVTFLEVPEVDLGEDRTVCDTEPTLLQAGGPDDNVTWSDGSTGTSLRVENSGTYSVIVDNGACTASDTVRINIQACGTENIFVPTAFSPNGDDVNDEFKPFISPSYVVMDYELMIFDRWGGQLFQTSDIDTGWDGTHNGQEVQVGVYVYMIRIKFTDGAGEQDEILKGDVAIVR